MVSAVELYFSSAFFLRQIHTYFLSNFQAYNAHQNYINKNEHIAGLPKWERQINASNHLFETRFREL